MIFDIPLLILGIAFIFKAIQDRSGKNGFKNSFWNASESWQLKYEMPLKRNHKHWYYFGFIKPIYKERFPFSTTALVFLTDGWHLSQFFFLNLTFIAIAINTPFPVLYFIVIRIIYAITFNSIYK